MNASIVGIQGIFDGLVVPSQNAMANPSTPKSKAKQIARLMLPRVSYKGRAFPVSVCNSN